MKKDPIEELYRSLYQDLLAYGIFLTKNRVQAEDLVSDAFYKLLLHIDTVPVSKRKYWLMRVMKNQYIDQIRKNKKYAYHGDYQSMIDQESKTTSDNLLKEVIKEEKSRELFIKIASLKPVYAEIVLLRYFLDFSIEEIAQYLTMTNGQGRTLLYRSRKLLKERMEQDGE